VADTKETPPADDILAATEPTGLPKGSNGLWVGAALGFGIGTIFALGGFWAGVLVLIFTILGAMLGRILMP
jgi:hypothetical protein